MPARRKIGIRYIDHKGWTGGIYYIINIVNALNFLDEKEKPVAVIFCNKADKKFILENITYPHLEFFFLDRKLSIGERIVNKAFSVFSKKTIFSTFPQKGSADFVFPNPEHYYFKNIPRIFWIPDFQEAHLPHFFSEEEIAARKNMQRKTADEADFLVLSSESAKKDFDQICPGSKAKITVLNFAVIHPDYKNIPAKALFEKYNLPEHYFFSPNQFWTHKNHILIIKAVEALKRKGKEVVVAFSGKEHDYRDPNYTDNLKKYVTENGLEKNIRFLGFLDRKEQLQLMNLSAAIIQPSLFEGWSTVIEDAKAMSQVILASDLDVHKEQLESWKGTSAFFKRDDYNELADKISDTADGKYKRIISDYDANIKKYARDFMNMARQISGK